MDDSSTAILSSDCVNGKKTNHEQQYRRHFQNHQLFRGSAYSCVRTRSDFPNDIQGRSYSFETRKKLPISRSLSVRSSHFLSMASYSERCCSRNLS